jgi:hypothetical protein
MKQGTQGYSLTKKNQRSKISWDCPCKLWWWNFKSYLTPSHSSSFLGGQRWQPIKMGHSLQIRGRGGGGLDNILMSMITTLSSVPHSRFCEGLTEYANFAIFFKASPVIDFITFFSKTSRFLIQPEVRTRYEGEFLSTMVEPPNGKVANSVSPKFN